MAMLNNQRVYQCISWFIQWISGHVLVTFTLSLHVITTVDGQNIQTLQQALCWTPAHPKSQCFSAREQKLMARGVDFFRPLGLMLATLTLFGAEGVVLDRQGFEYFVHLRYQLGCAACRTPQLVLPRSLMFSHLLVSKLCCGNITLHAADLIPNCANIGFSQVNAFCLSPVPFFSIP